MGKTSKWVKECLEYWDGKVYEGDLGIDFDCTENRCWRCGHASKLQKCHIIPKSLDGPDDVSNLIPLCGKCHDEAPDVNDKDAIWGWIAKDHGGLYDTYWPERAMKEIDFSKIRPKHFAKFKREYKKIVTEEVGRHFGQNGQGMMISHTSRVWAMGKALERAIP